MAISTPHYLPTPTQIRAACHAIQATWSPGEERYRRRRMGVPAETIPGVERFSEVVEHRRTPSLAGR